MDPHKRYLEKRGFDWKKLVQLWDLQGTGAAGGRLAWRIIIPVYQDNQIVTWMSRRITDQEPRYAAASPSESLVPIDRCVYGIDYCRNSAICVEGSADVWAIGPGACSTFGVRVSHAQTETLSKFPLRCVLFDAGDLERAAQQRAKDLCDKLSIFPGRTVRVILETGKDPGSCSEEEREQLRKEFLR